MKCSNCGADLSNDTKFCSYCGEKVETDNFNSCDNNVSESGKEETSNQTTFSPEKEKKSIFDSIKDRGVDFWNKLSSYEKVTTIALTIFVLMCLIAFLAGKVFAGIIALLSIALTVVAVLMKKQIIKVPKSWLHIVALAIAIVLIVPYCSLFGGNTNSPTDEGEEFSWTNLILGEVIPQPESDVSEIITNTESSLSVCINRTSTDDFYDYINACKDKGFITDAEQLTSSYEAYNESGYKLYMYYTESDNEMQIDVDAPVKYGELKWSDSGLGKLLPTPVSKVGEINKDDDKGFKAVVAETPIEAFKDYIKQCTEKGFSVDEIESEKSYDAKNTDGYKLSVKYTGNNVMSISLEEPEYQVNIEVECTENLIFSKYDVDVYVDDSLAGTLSHGATETYSVTLTKGTYTIKFVNAENDDVTGTVKIDVTKDEEYKFKISCYSGKIGVESNDDTADSNDDNADTSVIETTESSTIEQTESEKTPEPVFYSTNDYETAKKGNTGVFSYKNKGGSYDVYWIIDFNEGYVYWFTEGNGESFCDKVKIVSGDLNDKVIVTWHDDGDEWSWKLHFKYVEHPETLVINDHNGSPVEFTTTDLDDALKLRDTKTIYEY